MKNIADFIRFSWKFEGKTLYLQRVFHSIRFKVNKVGVQWYPIFFVLLLRFDAKFVLFVSSLGGVNVRFTI